MEAGAAASTTYHYQCESGEKVSVSYPNTELAHVHYQGNSHTMHIAVSGSGSRYVGDGLEWWTKGSGASIFRHEADGSSGESLESCTQTNGN